MSEGNHSVQITDFARALCSAADYRSLLSIISEELISHLRAENLLLWIYDEKQQRLRREASRLTSLSTCLVQESLPEDTGILSEVFKWDSARRLEDVHATPQSSVVEGTTLSSVLLAPLRDRARSIGVIEALNIESRFSAEEAELLEELARLAAPAICARREQDELSAGMLHAVTRLTQLYDVSQSFNSTIEFAELAPIICNRTASVMDVESCSLWLVEKEPLVCREVIGHYRRQPPSRSEKKPGRSGGPSFVNRLPLGLKTA